MSNPELTVCYAVTPDGKWRRHAAASLYSLAVTNPGVGVSVLETAPQKLSDAEFYDRFAFEIKTRALAEATHPVMFLDADTIVRDSLAPVMAGMKDFNARPYSRQEKNIDSYLWDTITGHFGLHSGVQLWEACAFLVVPWMCPCSS